MSDTAEVVDFAKARDKVRHKRKEEHLDSLQARFSEASKDVIKAKKKRAKKPPKGRGW